MSFTIKKMEDGPSDCLGQVSGFSKVEPIKSNPITSSIARSYIGSITDRVVHSLADKTVIPIKGEDEELKRIEESPQGVAVSLTPLIARSSSRDIAGSRASSAISRIRSLVPTSPSDLELQPLANFNEKINQEATQILHPSVIRKSKCISDIYLLNQRVKTCTDLESMEKLLSDFIDFKKLIATNQESNELLEPCETMISYLNKARLSLFYSKSLDLIKHKSQNSIDLTREDYEDLFNAKNAFSELKENAQALNLKDEEAKCDELLTNLALVKKQDEAAVKFIILESNFKQASNSANLEPKYWKTEFEALQLLAQNLKMRPLEENCEKYLEKIREVISRTVEAIKEEVEAVSHREHYRKITVLKERILQLQERFPEEELTTCINKINAILLEKAIEDSNYVQEKIDYFDLKFEEIQSMLETDPTLINSPEFKKKLHLEYFDPLHGFYLKIHEDLFTRDLESGRRNFNNALGWWKDYAVAMHTLVDGYRLRAQDAEAVV